MVPFDSTDRDDVEECRLGSGPFVFRRLRTLDITEIVLRATCTNATTPALDDGAKLTAPDESLSSEVALSLDQGSQKAVRKPERPTPTCRRHQH